MKICGACQRELSKDCYSKKQWQHKQYARRCRECVADDMPLTLKPPERPDCWICLSNEADERGELPLRDCSCRGEAGYAHVSCLAQYAQSKCRAVPTVDIASFVAWQRCPTCKQGFGCKLSMSMSSELLSFADRELSGNKLVRLVAEFMKFIAINNSGMADIYHNQPREDFTKQARIVLKLTEDLESKIESGSVYVNGVELSYISNIKAVVLKLIGVRIVNDKGASREDVDTAMVYFDQVEEIVKRSSGVGAYHLPDLERLRHRLSPDEDCKDEKFDVEYTRSRYCAALTKGDSHMELTGAAISYGLALQSNFKILDAERILTEALASSRRILGPAHGMTKRAADGLGICRAARYVFVKVKDAYQLFQVERYANGGKSLLAFVVQGSMQEGAKRKKGPLVVLDAAVARLGPYLPVYCHGFDGKESHLNGMIGLVDVHPILSHPMYSVQFDSATIGTREVRFDNLRILFDVPVESSVDLKRKELDVARSRDAPTAAVSLTQLQSEEKKRLVAHFQPQIEELRSIDSDEKGMFKIRISRTARLLAARAKECMLQEVSPELWGQIQSFIEDGDKRHVRICRDTRASWLLLAFKYRVIHCSDNGDCVVDLPDLNDVEDAKLKERLPHLMSIFAGKKLLLKMGQFEVCAGTPVVYRGDCDDVCNGEIGALGIVSGHPYVNYVNDTIGIKTVQEWSPLHVLMEIPAKGCKATINGAGNFEGDVLALEEVNEILENKVRGVTNDLVGMLDSLKNAVDSLANLIDNANRTLNK